MSKKEINWKYNIGDRIVDDKRDIEIIFAGEYKDKNGYIRKGYKYKCNKCGNTDYIRSYLIDETKCNACMKSPRKIVKGINDIATTNPEMVKYFVDIEDCYNTTIKSDKKFLMICPECNYIRKRTPHLLYEKGFCCPRCSDGISYPNKMMFNVLQQLNIKFENEKRFDWCMYNHKNKIKKGIYDFYIPSMDLIIEMDGRFHKKDNDMSGQTAEESKIIDNYKDRLANEHGFKVIRIDCDYKNVSERFEYIKNNIIKKLDKIFDLSNIKWENINIENNKSIKLKIIDYKNKNKECYTGDIAKIFNMSRTTICDYLKCGNKYGLCEYNPKEEKRNNSKRNGLKNGKRIKAIYENITYNFNSLSDACKFFKEKYNINLDKRGINKVLNSDNTYKNIYFKEIEITK